MGVLNSSVVSAATTDGASLYPIVLGGGGENTSEHHYKSGACNTVSCVMTCRSCTLRRGQVDIVLQ